MDLHSLPPHKHEPNTQHTTHKYIASHNYCRAHTQIREESEELLEEGSALDVEALEDVALHSAQDATDALIDPVDLVQEPLYDPIDLIQIEVFTSSAGTPDPKSQTNFCDKPSLSAPGERPGNSTAQVYATMQHSHIVVSVELNTRVQSKT